jgi:hypothetical protein
MSRHTVSSLVGVRNAPEAILSLSTMTPDYIDVFTVPTGDGVDKSPEEWARAVLEGTPIGRSAPKLWRSLGLRLGPRPSPDHVQGWKIADGGSDWVRVETASWYATAHAVVHVGDGDLSVALLIRYDRWIARLIWPPVSRLHRRGMPRLLRQGLRAATR